MQANERTGSEHNIQSEKTCMLYEAHTNCSKQASFSKLLIIQLKIKILSEEVMTTNFIQKSLEFIQLLICKKIVGVIFV